MKTLELLKEFLNAYFVEHNPEKGLGFVTDDIQCYDFADDQELHGIEELRGMAASDVYQKFMDAKLTIEKEHQVSEESAILNYSLSLNSIMIRGRIAGNSRRTSEGNKLYFMNNAVLNPIQTLNVFEDVARSKRDKLARELFMQSIPGGLMGGYMESGFPFYFINDTMLQYLGYESEEEFIQNIHGLIENCFYGEDRETVNREVDEQISSTGEYDIEYRMLKKDGNYIWVHDIGKKIVAEDGRNAILSVCYDITSEKEHERFLKGVEEGFNGDMAVFAVDLEKKRLIPTYVSDNMGMHEGISKEEFLKRSTETSMNSIYIEDRQRAWNSICDAAQKDDTPSISFRVLDQSGKAQWVNASFSKYGEHDGMPTVLALFADSTIQNDLQLYALNQNGTGIAVIDEDTHEVYFANDAIFRIMGTEPFDYTNKHCQDILASCGSSCEHCGLHEARKQKTLDRTLGFDGKFLSLHTECREWTGKSVVSIYATDVTEKIQLQKQMEDLFQNLPSAICLYRWDGSEFDRLYIGKGFHTLFGSGATKRMKSSQNMIFEIVHPDDVQDLRNHAAAYLKCEEDSRTSHQYRAWNEDKQAYIWVSLHVNKAKQSDGSYLIYAVFTDDMEQVLLKNRLVNTRTAIHGAIEYGQLGLWSYDITARVILQDMADVGSYGYDNKTKYSPKVFVSQKAIHEADAETYLACYRKIHDGAEQSDCIVRVFNQKSNSYRWIHIYLVRKPNAAHTNPMAIGMSFDIHQEVTNYEALSKAQAQLKQEKQVIDELFENLPGGIVMYRWHQKVLSPLYVSKGFSDLYGEDGEDVIRRAKNLHFDVVHPDDLTGLQAFILNHIEKTGQFMTYRYRVWNKQKKDYIWIQLTGNVKRQPDGTSIAYANYANVDAEVKAAEEVRKEEELLEKTCQLAHIWMFHYNLQSKQVRLSKTLQDDFQLPATIDNFPDGFLVYPVIPKEYHTLYRQMIQKVDVGEDATTEMPVEMPDGTHRFVRFEWHITRKENGKTVEVAGLPIDITREVAERRRIKKERERLLGGDKKLTAYSITNLQSETIVEAKDYYLGTGIQTGDTCEEFIQKLEPFVLTKDDKQYLHKIFNSKFAIAQFEAGITEWSKDMRWVKADGRARWQRNVYSLIEDSNTGTLYLYCYLYDVMEEKMAQALFAGIQNNLYLKTGIVSFASGKLYNFEGDFTKRYLKVLDFDTVRKNYIATEVIQEDAAMAQEQGSLENIKSQLASGQKDFAIVNRVMKDGELRYHQVRFATVPGQSDICICVLRDITDLMIESEQKNVELQKALAAANAATQAKSEFLSRMSHEIRTPMNAIMGMTAIAQDNKTDFLQVSDCLSKIDSSSQYLLTLINDILEMSRIESGKTKISEEKFDFSQLIEGIRTVAEPLAKKSEIRLEIINRTANGSYYGDHIRIQQVMINLLGNALKFTKKSGRVRFVISAAEDIEMKTIFEFMVEDTGIGMSEEFMQKMFEPFSQEDSTTTSQYGGSGLGLAISKSLVEAMDGTITAESMVGIGTNFTVRIPLKKAQSNVLLKKEKTEEISEAEQDDILKGKRILMAEDHPMNIMIAKKLLERKGIQITVAENGKIAVETFRNSDLHEYDAILMDIRMPVMDGLEATRQIRALDRPDAKEIPIIAMTANALEEDRRNSKAAGMDEHLAKPIDPKRMYQTLAQQIARGNV